MSSKQPNSWKIAFVLIALLTGVGIIWFVLAQIAKNADKLQELSNKLRQGWDDAQDTRDFAQKRMHYWQRQAKQELAPLLKNVGESLQKAKYKMEAETKPVKRVEKEVEKLRQSVDNNFDLSQRQEQIYQIIKRAKQAGINSFVQQVADVTPRTLRRDLTRLEKLGLVEQIGKTKDSYYRLKN